MTPEQITATASAVVLIMGGFGALLIKLREIHVLVNDKYDKALRALADQAAIIASLIGKESDKALARKANQDATPKSI